MPDRIDNLAECNQLKVPVEDFKLFWCNRCLQPGCTRSLYGTTKFERRVTTWLDRLFLRVPKMEQGDPRFRDISRKEFLPVLDSWEVSSDIPVESEKPDQPISFLAVPTEDMLIQEVSGSEGTETQPEDEPTVQSQEVSTPRSIPSKSNLEAAALMNTANRTGLYLPGSPTSPTESVNGSGRETKPSVKGVSTNDPWAAPEQRHPSEFVVEAGATIRLGGSK